MSSARTEILERIRKALAIPSKQRPEEPDWEKPIFSQNADEQGQEADLAIIFAETLTSKSGQFVFVENYSQLYDDLAAFIAERGFTRIACWELELAEVLAYKGIRFQTDDQDLEAIEVSFTLCEALVARTGSVLVSSSQGAGRRLTIYPPIHVVVATASQLVPDIGDGLLLVKEKYPRFPSMVSLVSGPSRTADIEKTLVLGAHGPKELIVFLVDDLAPGPEPGYQQEQGYYEAPQPSSYYESDALPLEPPPMVIAPENRAPEETHGEDRPEEQNPNQDQNQGDPDRP